MLSAHPLRKKKKKITRNEGEKKEYTRREPAPETRRGGGVKVVETFRRGLWLGQKKAALPVKKPPSGSGWERRGRGESELTERHS